MDLTLEYHFRLVILEMAFQLNIPLPVALANVLYLNQSSTIHVTLVAVLKSMLTILQHGRCCTCNPITHNNV